MAGITAPPEGIDAPSFLEEAGQPSLSAQWSGWTPEERDRWVRIAAAAGWQPETAWTPGDLVAPRFVPVPWSGVSTGEQAAGGGLPWNEGGGDAPRRGLGDGEGWNPPRLYGGVLEALADALRRLMGAALDLVRRALDAIGSALAGLLGGAAGLLGWVALIGGMGLLVALSMREARKG